MKLLDAGVSGLICPLISMPELAAKFVSYCRYPPQGIRSFGPTRAALADPDYLATANDRVIRAVQIEEAAASQAHKLTAAIHCLSRSYAARLHKLGFRFITLASDLRILARATKELIDTARADMEAAFRPSAGNAALTGC